MPYNKKIKNIFYLKTNLKNKIYERIEQVLSYICAFI